MSDQNTRFLQIIQAIDAERKHEAAFFKTLHESKGIHEKVAAGFVWYPVEIIRKSYTVGEYLEIEVKKQHLTNFQHRFSEGTAVALFNIQDERKEFKGVTSFARGDRMKILIHSDQIEKLEIFDKGLTGVEMIYDEKPYKVMEKAIRLVMESKEPNIVSLRNGISTNTFKDHDLTIEDEQWIDSKKYLNDSQKLAIKTSTTAPNIAIIHGPPGTGKTTTITALTEFLLKTEKRILVCASSNNAVDLLATKLTACGVNVLRVGNISRIHDDLVHLTIEEKVRNHSEWNHIKKVRVQAREMENKSSQYKRNFGHEEREERKQLRKEARDLRKWAVELEDRLIDDIVLGSQVIATTLIGVSHRIIDKLSFQTVIIDEASQALEAECWNAILKAKRVILAGDHKQLPPTVKSQEAMKFGMETTLLDILTDQIKHSSLLTVQYRMNSQILAFSNVRHYQGRLTSHTDVQDARLRNDHLPLVFIDTAGCGFEEEMQVEQKSYTNPGEYFIIREHILANLEKILGVNIGIISPYSAQVRYIREQISEDTELRGLDIEINSIDGFQGQEKDMMYISLVRANERGEIGFLKDERRLNVAMTRARLKMVIVGDSATLGQTPLFSDLINHVELEGHYDSAWNYMGY